eukprot:1744893-Amphidinium_carterae.1
MAPIPSPEGKSQSTDTACLLFVGDWGKWHEFSTSAPSIAGSFDQIPKSSSATDARVLSWI